jgi:hypothetical protein
MEEKVSRGYLRGVKHGRFSTYSVKGADGPI